jgi:hypothetical protein
MVIRAPVQCVWWIREAPILKKRFISCADLGKIHPSPVHALKMSMHGNLQHGQHEQREAQRMPVHYLLEFSVAGRDSFGAGRAVDHSETGMNFVTDTPLQPGSYLTMRVPVSNAKAPILMCLANVVRCLALPEADGYYSVSCAYD